jgi:hypothetical protein
VISLSGTDFGSICLGLYRMPHLAEASGIRRNDVDQWIYMHADLHGLLNYDGSVVAGHGEAWQ